MKPEKDGQSEDFILSCAPEFPKHTGSHPEASNSMRLSPLCVCGGGGYAGVEEAGVFQLHGKRETVIFPVLL